MKTLVKIVALSLLLMMTACSKSDDSIPDDPIGKNDPPKNDPPMEVSFQMQTVATGLSAPQGIEIDAQGRLWIAEQGSGEDNGRISVLDANGIAQPFMTNIPSATEEGSPGSAHHLLIEADTIWAVVGMTSKVPGGDLLKLDISGFSAGDTPLVYDESYAVANIADLTLNHGFSNNTGESNAYNLNFGPEGNIYIVDAAANAVVKYDRITNELEVVAELPTIANSSGMGPPFMDAVPTGIMYQGSRFLVSAFVGFPFNPGDSRIYAVTPTGIVNTIEEDFTGAVDLTGIGTRNFVVQYASFGPQGFTSNSGKIIMLENDVRTTIADNLNFPNGICLASDGTLYVTLITGSVLKFTEN